MSRPQYIINFPTKQHWKDRSSLEYIQGGLIDLIKVVQERKIRSIAVPPLGCGNGGLAWRDVEPMIREAFDAVPLVEVHLFAPGGPPRPREMLVGTKKPALTIPRAAIVRLIERYLVADYTLTALEAQKLAYFLQVAGLPMKLQYVKAQYGPYAENLNHALQALEGHYLRGYGDRSSEMEIRTMPMAGKEAMDYLAHHPRAAGGVDHVVELVRGFETPYGLELLATTHWAAIDAATADPQKILSYVRAWNTRKGEIFTEPHVCKALARLRGHGYVQ